MEDFNENKNYQANLQNSWEELSEIDPNLERQKEIEQIKNQTTSIYKKLVKEKKNCLKYINVDYSTLSLNDKEQLGALVNNTKSLSMLLGKTLEESK